MPGAPPLLRRRISRAEKRQERQKSRAAVYRAAPHHYAAPVYRPSTVGGTPRPQHRYTLPRTFRTEAPTQSAGLRRAARYKRTAPYRQAIRQTYREQPLAARRRQANRILATPPAKRSAEQKTILRAHRARQRTDAAARRRTGGALPRVQLRSALAQQRYFVSQGREVAHAAAQQRAQALERQAKSPDVIFSTDPKVLKAAGFKKAGLGEQLAEAPIRAAANVPKDVAELAITTPTSLVHLGAQGYGAGKSLATGHPGRALKQGEQIGKEFIEPYKQLVKDPVGFATEHPVTTALMVSPAGKLPGRVIGRVGRVAGRSTLKRAPATLPGTSMRAARTAHHDPIASRIPRPGRLSKHVRGGGRIPRDELNKRVDEFYDAGQQHKHNATASAAQDARRRFGRIKDKAERTDAIQTHLSGARAGAHQHVERRFAHEFGSHWQVHPRSGAVVKPKRPREGSGVIHATREEAQKVADAIKRAGHFDPKIVELDGATPGETSGFAVVPREVAQRFNKQKVVGSSPAVGAVTLRVAGRQFRRTVLPTSPKWLGGQATEAAFRAAVRGAGPTSLLRGRKILKRIEREHGKSVADEVRARTVGGGQFGASGPSGEFAGRSPTLAEEYAAHHGTRVGDIAEAATRFGAKPGVRHISGAYRRYTDFVFNKLNAPIEGVAKTALLGKAAKTGPLMERRVIGLGEKAVGEAAKGLTNTSAQAELGRAIDRAYGRYSKFSPAMRETILHTTPFVPWLLNMGHFLGRVLPEDHPVKTALMADLGQADKEWRKAHRQSLYGDHVPDFMLGAYPKGNRFVPVGRFGPFAPGDVTGAIGQQVLPQVVGPLENLALGVDWTGRKIPGGQGRQASNAALTLAETFVPLLSQVDRATGLGEHYVRGKKKKPSVRQGKSLPKGLLEQVNPIRSIGTTPQKKRKRKGVDFGAGLNLGPDAGAGKIKF